MREVLSVLVGLGVLWVIGSLIVCALRMREPNSPTRNFLELAVGFVLLAFMGMTTIALGGRMSFGWTYVALGMIAGVALLCGGRPGLPATEIPRETQSRALILGVGLVFVFLALGTLGDRLLWDAWAFWTLKAHAIFVEGTLPPEMTTLAGPYPWTHPEYPLGLPLTDWWIFKHLGSPSPVAASFAGAIWLLLLAIVVWQGLAREVSGRWAGAAAMGIVSFWPITMSALGGYAEILITLAILGATLELARAPGAFTRASVLRLVVFLCFAAAAKNEGQALILVAAPVVAWKLWRSGERDRGPYLLLTVPILYIAPWLMHVRQLGVSAEQVGTSLPISILLSRIPLLGATFVDLFTTRAWIGVSLVLIAGLLARRARGRFENREAWAFILGYFAVTQVVLLLTPLDLAWLIVDTYFRLIGTMVPAALYLSVREMGLLGLESRRPDSGLLGVRWQEGGNAAVDGGGRGH